MRDEQKTTRLKKIISLVSVFILMPVTIALGIIFLDSSKFYVTSILIIIYALIIFFLVFERGRPSIKEIVLIAVMSAIAVVGRAAFFAIPQFKPVCAVVIIAGICFGAQAGFMVGAISELVSNFLFGQGMWTPFQMFAMGLVGFLAGLFFKRLFKTSPKGPKTLILVCIYGAFSSFIIYGTIVEISSVLMMVNEYTFKSIAAVYIAGIPWNAVHMLATVLFLVLLYNPMVGKIKRIKTKYGLMDKAI